MKKIAIQGGKASFHHMAATRFMGEEAFTLVENDTFPALCKSLLEGDADLALMAVENTVAGSILPNYALLETNPLFIIEEVYLEIEHHLMALPGQEIGGIKNVYSHPMALLQCSRYLEDHPHLVATEAHDTADSARDIARGGTLGAAAIAGRMAAEIYGLEILGEAIQNQKRNITRFLVLSAREQADAPAADKASINFRLPHQVGALAEALDIFRRHGLNLTLIQSLPIPHRPHEYTFHVDLEWHDGGLFHHAMDALRDLTGNVALVGVYKKGAKPHDHPVSQTA